MNSSLISTPALEVGWAGLYQGLSALFLPTLVLFAHQKFLQKPLFLLKGKQYLHIYSVSSWGEQSKGNLGQENNREKV